MCITPWWTPFEELRISAGITHHPNLNPEGDAGFCWSLPETSKLNETSRTPVFSARTVLVANHEGDAGFCCCITAAEAKYPSIIPEALILRDTAENHVPNLDFRISKKPSQDSRTGRSSPKHLYCAIHRSKPTVGLDSRPRPNIVTETPF